jgi:tRNA-splicing ligase RtcB
LKGRRKTMNFERLGQYKYRIPREGKMQVDAAFYASERILDDLAAEDYASLRQLQNVATLPGIVEPALTMPDIHWGYGFPIGGVAAFDPKEGGVVSPGGVGFDVNCGVRLLTSEIDREELELCKDRLADALYEAVPSGMGRGRTDFRMSREELAEVLVEGPAPLVERGFGEAEDLGHIESRGKLSGADPGAVSARAY